MTSEQEVQPLATALDVTDGIGPVLVDQLQFAVDPGPAHALDEVTRHVDFASGRAGDVDHLHQCRSHRLTGDESCGLFESRVLHGGSVLASGGSGSITVLSPTLEEGMAPKDACRKIDLSQGRRRVRPG